MSREAIYAEDLEAYLKPFKEELKKHKSILGLWYFKFPLSYLKGFIEKKSFPCTCQEQEEKEHEKYRQPGL